MPTPNAPPDAAVTRFRADLGAVIGATADVQMGIAVSGGGDSLALLLLASAALPGQIQAATIDHGLRPESVDEAAFVAAVCAKLGVPHSTFPVTIGPRGNRSANARLARYAVLDRWAKDANLDWVATGHHADDQLETMIMRLNRGSGVGGLAGIRVRHGRIIRPVLGWRRKELRDVVNACGLTAIDDPSNHDDRYDRARLRRALAGADWLDAVAVAKSATLLAQADAALEWASTRLIAEAASPAIDLLDPIALPPEIARRVVLQALRQVDPVIRPRGGALVRLIATLERGGTATIGGVLCASKEGRWLFSNAPPRRFRPDRG